MVSCSQDFYHGSNISRAMVIAQPCWTVDYHLTEMTRTNMCVMIAVVVEQPVYTFDSCDISDNSDSSDSKQKQTSLGEFVTVCISGSGLIYGK